MVGHKRSEHQGSEKILTVLVGFVMLIIAMVSIFLIASVSDSIADPTAGPLVPTIHPKSTSHTSIRSNSTHTARTTAHSKPTTSSRPPVSSTHPRPTISRTSSTNSSSLTISSSMATSNSGATGAGHGNGTRNGNNKGIFNFHLFDPCQLSRGDFTHVGLPPMEPRRGFLFFSSHSRGRRNYHSAGRKLTADYCYYADNDIFFSNHHFVVSKESHQGNGQPLSLSDARPVISENIRANFDGTARFEDTTINGCSALIVKGYDSYGYLVSYGIYVNGVLFEFDTDGGQLASSDYDALHRLVEEVIPAGKSGSK